MAVKRKFNIPLDEYAVEKKQEVLKQNNDDLENDKTKIYNVSRETLIMDDDNSIIYGDETPDSVHLLAEDIKNNGFKGAIMAYPVNINGKKMYKIESGHRRYLAAIEAGLEEIPVIITAKPKTDAERRIRLISMNLHSRESLKPTTMARVIETLLESNKEEQERQNLPTDLATLTEIVANQVELSTTSVYKYRQIPKLIPELRVLADNGISWSALVQCSSLPEFKQTNISEMIVKEISRVGAENVSRQWILLLINKLKQDESGELVKPKTVVKRRDGTKIIAKCAKDFTDIANGNALFKEEDKQKNIDNLKKIRDCIDIKIKELEE